LGRNQAKGEFEFVGETRKEMERKAKAKKKKAPASKKKV